jgi:fucose 4-O-acetylase-like acetyltransferase
MRNREMDILKALGIIVVVIGHIYQPFTWFPPYSYHMALFIFISGFFYKTGYEDQVKNFLKRRIVGLALPYFGYLLFYALVTQFLYVKFNIKLCDFPVFSLYNFFVAPFISGHQFHLFLAGWFVIELLVIHF